MLLLTTTNAAQTVDELVMADKFKIMSSTTRQQAREVQVRGGPGTLYVRPLSKRKPFAAPICTGKAGNRYDGSLGHTS